MTQAPSEFELLQIEAATLRELLAVQEEQARSQFELIRAQRRELEERARSLHLLNAELETTATFLRELYRTMPGALMVADRDGIIESANEAAAEMLGYAETELVGLALSQVFATSDHVDVGALGRLAGERTVLRTEKSLLAKSGAEIPVLLCVAAFDVEGAASEVTKIVCIALDIRDRKQLEVGLRQAQKLEAVGRLAAGVAHEINTPVQFVNDSILFVRDSAAELLIIVEKLQLVRRSVLEGGAAREAALAASKDEEAADLPYLFDEVPKAIDRSLEGLRRIANIVRSMKEFAHPDSKVMVPTDINRAVESTLTIARNEYRYVADLETDLGELPLVPCYAGELNQAVLNLVVNAAHAIGDVVEGTDRKGVIAVRTRRDGDGVIIAVSDTGSGIPLEIRERVFDPFFTTKDVGKGAGQGLAVARSVVVDKHRGALSFESEVGKGTTFTIRIPL